MPLRPAPSAEDLQRLLLEVTDDLACRSQDIWRPTFDSVGDKEADLAAAELRSDGTTLWGPGPSQVVWATSELLYVAVLEHARAVVPLLSPPFRVWASCVQTRATLEAATQIYWLLDPAVTDGRMRVGRLYTLRLASSKELKKAHAKVQPPGPITDYGKPPADIEAEASVLGLTPVPTNNGAVIGYEGQRALGYAARVEDMLGEGATYSVLSGAAHAEIWSLLSGSQGKLPSPFGLSDAEHAAEVEDLAPNVMQCLRALIDPLDRVCQLFDRRAVARHLHKLTKRIHGVLRL
jgi:hypothetical protein